MCFCATSTQGVLEILQELEDHGEIWKGVKMLIQMKSICFKPSLIIISEM